MSGSRLDPQTAAVTITGADPPVGLTGRLPPHGTSLGWWTAASAARTRPRRPGHRARPVHRGAVQAPSGMRQVAALNGLGDYDGQFRPQLRTLRVRTPWDLGADELPGVPVPCAMST